MTMHAMRRSLRTITYALRLFTLGMTVTLAASCDSVSGPDEPIEQPITGTYDLADVGGNRLPANVYDGPYTIDGQRVNVRIDVVGGELELRGTRYTTTLALMLNVQGKTAPLPLTDEGEFSREGGEIVFESDDPETGSYRGNVTRDGVSVAIDLTGDRRPPTFSFRK